MDPCQIISSATNDKIPRKFMYVWIVGELCTKKDGFSGGQTCSTELTQDKCIVLEKRQTLTNFCFGYKLIS